MNILIIGSGGREYAIGLRLKQDKNVKKLYFSPGNGATKELGTNIIAKDYYELADFAKKNDIALSVVGPENALSAGVVDIFKEKGLNIFGPT
ncbi:MAG: phosphoribosylamine--glycine ligase, partial [Campylobacter hyointestinalis]